jgi:hypothetical protein
MFNAKQLVRELVVDLLLEIERDAKSPQVVRACEEMRSLVDPVSVGKIVIFSPEDSFRSRPSVLERPQVDS